MRGMAVHMARQRQMRLLLRQTKVCDFERKITDELRAKVRAIVLPQGIKLAQAELAKDSFSWCFAI